MVIDLADCEAGDRGENCGNGSGAEPSSPVMTVLLLDVLVEVSLSRQWVAEEVFSL